MQSTSSSKTIQLDSSVILTLEQLRKATGCTVINAAKYLEFIRGTLKAFDIDSELRVAAFLSQIAHESASLSRITENLNYSAEGLTRTWPKRFPADVAMQYARNPERIANRAYASRMGNGEEASGDGWLYRGRSFIQLTGKNNYADFSEYFKEDFLVNPDKLLEPVWCCLAAGWYWNVNNLNSFADKEDHEGLTRRINGGLIGLDDRMQKLKKAKEALRGFDAVNKS